MHHSAADERSRFEAILEAGDLIDACRYLHPDDQRFTSWDYRQGAFHRGLGLRIDYLLASDAIASRLEECGISARLTQGQEAV